MFVIAKPKYLLLYLMFSKAGIAVSDLSFKHPACSQYLHEVSKTLAEAVAELT